MSFEPRIREKSRQVLQTYDCFQGERMMDELNIENRKQRRLSGFCWKKLKEEELLCEYSKLKNTGMVFSPFILVFYRVKPLLLSPLPSGNYVMVSIRYGEK